jgi:peptide/nickel transport system permease protein
MSVPKFMRTRSGAAAVALLTFILLVAILGPLVAPYSPTAPIGPPGQMPSSHALLGTDYLGRDVLSRLLHGGLSVVWMGVAATVISYLIGITVGLTAGFARNWLDAVLMRAVDVLLAFPALLVLLLLVGGLGTHIWVLIVGVVLVQLPGISRVIRTATLEVSVQGFVEAAEARGESTPSILRREILPNIAAVSLADFGIRFSTSIILIASMNYLGLGISPPASDWGLMISENRDYISLNPFAVLAPGVMLAVLTIAVNLVADAFVRSLGRSEMHGAATVVTGGPAAVATAETVAIGSAQETV